jgi:steroid delta-isomerase-like uncharacterized protein
MTITLIQKYYDAFNRRDYTGMLALLSQHVLHDINQGGRELGKQRFKNFLARMDQAYSEQIEQLVVLADAGGTRFAAEFIVRGKYLQADPGFPPAHGQSYLLAAGAFFEVRGGQITRVTTYYNLQEWLNQVRGTQ